MPKKNSYPTVTDQFCGAGGSSIGATQAGATLKLGLNHWQLAIETHNTNFPDAVHDCTDISACDPRRYASTDILITSPECTNHSLAKGKPRKWQKQMQMFGKVELDPGEERSRATMWDVPRFAEYHSYNFVIVENVVEARHWVMWDAWLHAMDLLGYDHQCVYVNSMHAHPTPQSRDRMYVVFWKKGNRRPNLDITPRAFCPKCGHDVRAVQSWKNGRRWGRYRKQYVYCCPACASVVEPYYYCAANAIDWSLPAQKIGDRARPLKEKTLRRVQVGLEKFAGAPYLVVLRDSRQAAGKVNRPVGLDEPLSTIVATASQHWLVTPYLVSINHSTDRAVPITQEMPTTMPQGNPYLVAPFIAEMHNNSTAHPVTDPLATLCASTTHHALVMPYLIETKFSHATNDRSSGIDDVMPTQTTQQSQALVVPPFLASYYGTNEPVSIDEAVPTVTATDRHALVVPPFILSSYTRLSGQQAAVHGVDDALPTLPGRAVHYIVQPGELPQVEDCGFRMLEPHECGAAMAFPTSYKVLGNKRERVRQYGNAVTPPVMELLMQRCIEALS